MAGPSELIRQNMPAVVASSSGQGGNDGYLTAQQYEALLNGASPGGSTLTYATVAALRAGTVPASATYAVLLGYYAAGDNGGGSFYYDENSVATDDGGLVFKPSSVSGAGRWIRLYNSRSLNPKWFGAVGDGTGRAMSTYFGTLAAAQAIYPSTESLSDYIDGVATQSAINAIKGTPGQSSNRGGIIQFTGGNYVMNTKLSMARSLGMTLRGLSGGSASGVPSSGGVTITWAGSGTWQNPYYTAPFVDARSSYFFSMLWINIQYTDPTYLGHLVEICHYGGATIEGGVSGIPDITFNGTTITRPSGSFITDGWAVGDIVRVLGSALNDGNNGVITQVTATTITTAATTWASETVDFDITDGLYSSYPDTQMTTIRNCSFVQNNGAITVGTGAKALLAMSGSIICSIENCFFGTARTAILFRDFGYGSGVYSNAHVVRNCQFAYHQYSMVSGGQDIVIDGCTFEGLGGVLKAIYRDECFRTKAQIENTFTFDPVAKTVTRTGGSFITDGWTIGYAAKYGRADGYFGDLGNVTNVTATVLTCDGTFPTGAPFVVLGVPQPLYDFDVYNDTVNNYAGIESTSQLGNTLVLDNLTITRSDGGSFIDDGWVIGEPAYGPGGGGIGTVAGVAADTLTFEASVGSATHTSGYYIRGYGGGGPISITGCWLGDQFRFDSWIKPLGVAGLVLDGNFIDSNAQVIENQDLEMTGHAGGNVFSVLRPYQAFLFQGTNGITGFKFTGNAGGGVRGQSAVSNANLVMMANKSIVTGEAFQQVDDTYIKQVLRFSGGMLLTKDVYNPFGVDTPHTLLQLAGPIAWKYEASDINITIDDEDSFIDLDATNGNRTATLPTAVGIAGREYTIKRVDNSGNTAGVATTGGQTIDGAASPYSLAAQNDTITVVSNGSNWRVKSLIA